MSLYDEIISAQLDLEKLRSTRIFKTEDEAVRYAERHGMTVVELPAPQEAGTRHNTATATATIETPAAWQAVPRGHEDLRQREPRSTKMADHARAAKVNPLMRTVKHRRDKLNDARASLAKASASADQEDVMTATATLIDARQNLQKAEDNLVQQWNAAMNRPRVPGISQAQPR